MVRSAKVRPPAAKRRGLVNKRASIILLWREMCLLVLTGVSSTVFQLPLSPSHGSIPPEQYRNEVTVVFVTLTLVLRTLHPPGPFLDLSRTAFALSCLVTWTPLIQFALAPTARFAGPALSAAFITAVTFGPMVALAVNEMASKLEVHIAFPGPRSASTVVLGLIAAAMLTIASSLSDICVPALVNLHPLLTRPMLPFFIPPLMMLFISSSGLLWLAALLYLLSWPLIPHTSFAILSSRSDRSLNDIGYRILRREESLTGYLSVVENRRAGYRALRCDHSLLGGEWIPNLGSWPGGEGHDGPTGLVGEPVYAVFVMLEAIRLVRDATTGLKDAETEHGPVISDNEAKALVIGLGIGTTPGALIAHGINTTVVEIDPVVHKMALDFFNLSKNHTAYIEDATVFVKNQIVEMATEVQARNAAAKDSSKEDMVLGKYDYIVHDVFTGGAEPVDLFTETFIRSLSYLLKPDGVIAINYATDVFLPSASYVYTTVLSVFPNCRLFRDTDPAESNASSATSDFTNTVLFCRKAKNPFVFRDPIKSDYLGSSIRQAWLKPKYEVSLEPFVGNRNGNGWELDFSKVLTKDRVFELKKWHAASAARHWELMRTVMPDIVWERW